MHVDSNAVLEHSDLIGKNLGAEVSEAVPKPASVKASSSFWAFSGVASISMSRSNVERGTPYNTDAIPPITKYLTNVPVLKGSEYVLKSAQHL